MVLVIWSIQCDESVSVTREISVSEIKLARYGEIVIIQQDWYTHENIHNPLLIFELALLLAILRTLISSGCYLEAKCISFLEIVLILRVGLFVVTFLRLPLNFL